MLVPFAQREKERERGEGGRERRAAAGEDAFVSPFPRAVIVFIAKSKTESRQRRRLCFVVFGGGTPVGGEGRGGRQRKAKFPSSLVKATPPTLLPRNSSGDVSASTCFHLCRVNACRLAEVCFGFYRKNWPARRSPRPRGFEVAVVGGKNTYCRVGANLGACEAKRRV